MGTYNLTDNVQDDFSFEIRGKKFLFRYPVTEELEKIQDMMFEAQTAQDAGDKELSKRLADETQDYLYQFIEPDGHTTPFTDVFAKENVKVMKNFYAMVKTELSIQ